VSEKT